MSSNCNERVLIRVELENTETRDIESRVRQGCIIPP